MRQESIPAFFLPLPASSLSFPRIDSTFFTSMATLCQWLEPQGAEARSLIESCRRLTPRRKRPYFAPWASAAHKCAHAFGVDVRATHFALRVDVWMQGLRSRASRKRLTRLPSYRRRTAVPPYRRLVEYTARTRAQDVADYIFPVWYGMCCRLMAFADGRTLVVCIYSPSTARQRCAVSLANPSLPVWVSHVPW